MRRVQNININRGWEEVHSESSWMTLRGSRLWRRKKLPVTEIAGEIEVSHDKTLMDEELPHS